MYANKLSIIIRIMLRKPGIKVTNEYTNADSEDQLPDFKQIQKNVYFFSIVKFRATRRVFPPTLP